LHERKEDLETPSGPNIAAAQMAAFRDWERSTGTRFADLNGIHQPTLVVNGIQDEMIPAESLAARAVKSGPVGVESKLSTTTGQLEIYVAIRLRQHLKRADTAPPQTGGGSDSFRR
jgi:pimeloyl-ACP methyl ester carboxylesterase